MQRLELDKRRSLKMTYIIVGTNFDYELRSEKKAIELAKKRAKYFSSIQRVVKVVKIIRPRKKK